MHEKGFAPVSLASVSVGLIGEDGINVDYVESDAVSGVRLARSSGHKLCIYIACQRWQKSWLGLSEEVRKPTRGVPGFSEDHQSRP